MGIFRSIFGGRGRLYKKEKGKLLCSEDGGKTWFELFEHLEKEHGIKIQDKTPKQKEVRR